MSHPPPAPSDPHPQDGRRGPSPSGDGVRPGRGTGAKVDPVDAEWATIEDERVAEEVAEAREDVIGAIADPVGRRRAWRWMWWAFAAALVAGIVFAGWIDFVVAMNRPTPDTTVLPPPPSGPSPSESGPGTAGDGDETPAAATDEPAPGAAAEPERRPTP